MNRRTFIQSGLLLCTQPFPLTGSTREQDYLMTVNGPVSADAAGFVLPHEHILVDFIGADQVTPSRYEVENVVAKALPFLKQVRERGCHTLVECTPAWLGRDVRLLQRLSAASGLHLLTNTGYYGAAREKFLPAHAYTESAGELAARWIQEWREGIEGTGIRPGFIKTGLDNAPLSEVQQKLVRAAALTHLETGLTIGVHTGNGLAALEELKIIRNEGVRPEAWIWIHAQNETDRAIHLEVARAGGWVSFDGLNDPSVAAYVRFLNDMKAAQQLHRVLISHDAGWYHVGEPDGGKYRSYDTVFTHLLPALEQEGFTPQDIDLIFRQNPAMAFAVRVRN